MTDSLRPCPFCGDFVSPQVVSTSERGIFVACDCGAEGPGAGEGDRELAVRQWNERSGDGVGGVIIESPYAGDVERNLAYARECLRDSLMRGEAPFASHLLYTQPGVLDDDDPEQRRQGMEAGFSWFTAAAAIAVYIDFGISPGMAAGIVEARLVDKAVEYRSIYPSRTLSPEEVRNLMGRRS